jgi:S-adenosylmethionine hydrolase
VAIVTLLTDFGTADTYVGQMKGAILAVAPAVTLVDLSHAVPPQDVRTAAFLLWSAVEAFPAGSIHLAVVDPGVGSARRAVALRSRRADLFVGPDNGVLMPAVDRLGGLSAAVELLRSDFWRATPSSTFHGRDIFGPAAAHLASGVPLERLGAPLADPDTSISWPTPSGLVGEVIHVDAYGNLVTNLPGRGLPPRFHARVRGVAAPSGHFYAAVAPGEPIALVGSAGLLEISVRDGSAAHTIGARCGDQVNVTPDL